MVTENKSINITNDDVQTVLNTESGKYQLQIAALTRTLGDKDKEIQVLKDNSCSCNESEDENAD
jgi:hypothetical protein